MSLFHDVFPYEHLQFRVFLNLAMRDLLLKRPLPTKRNFLHPERALAIDTSSSCRHRFSARALRALVVFRKPFIVAQQTQRDKLVTELPLQRKGQVWRSETKGRDEASERAGREEAEKGAACVIECGRSARKMRSRAEKRRIGLGKVGEWPSVPG